MATKLNTILLFIIIFFSGCRGNEFSAEDKTPESFVDVSTAIPSVQLDIRYYTAHNFTGSKIDGYNAAKCYLTREAANALKQVQETLKRHQKTLKIFDCYRPQRAVNHFVRWAKDLNDVKMKAEFYPSVNKKNLFRDGYIAEKSGHSRGSTLDLTLVDLKSHRELDMGTAFDFFDPLSHTNNSKINTSQKVNRNLLKTIMEQHGFKNLKEEWWHYTLVNEPYPDSYFDFKID